MSGGAGEEWKVHQQKLRVVYLPPEGQVVEEEEEEGQLDDFPSIPAPKRFGSDVRSARSRLGSAVDTIPHFQGENIARAQPQPTSPPPAPARPVTPPRVREPDNLYRDLSRDESPKFPRSTSGPGVGIVNVNVQPSPPSPPPPQPPTPAIQINRELEHKLSDAQAEIQRLRILLAAVPDPSSTAPESVAPESVAPSDFRRKYTASSEDGASTYYGETEVGTTVDRETVIHQDGVPLQVVIIIALGVFITTYLFF